MKKKLLTIGHSYVVSLNRSLMRELHHRGNIDVTVISPSHFDGDLRPISMEAEPESSKLNVVPISCYLSKKIHFFFYHPMQLKKILREYDYDYDYFYLWEEPYIVSGYQVARELIKLNKPYAIFNAQNIVKNYPWPFSLFEKNSLSGSHAVWPCGELVNECLNKKGYSGLNKTVMPLPVDLENFKPMSLEAKNKKKQELHIKHEKLIGFMGRFTAEKGIDVFMKVFEKLPQDVGALIIGSGPLEPQIRKWVQTQNLRERVKVLSVNHADVPQVLPLVDALLCPSQPTSFWLEQFGRMVVEAMACGVPVLGSRSGEIPYVIGEAGGIVDPTDVSSWVFKTQQILTQQDYALQMKDQGLLRAQNYSAKYLAGLVEENILASLNAFK